MGILSKLFGPKAPTVLPVHVDDSNFNAEVRQSSISLGWVLHSRSKPSRP